MVALSVRIPGPENLVGSIFLGTYDPNDDLFTSVGHGGLESAAIVYFIAMEVSSLRVLRLFGVSQRSSFFFLSLHVNPVVNCSVTGFKTVAQLTQIVEEIGKPMLESD